jgi:hypothetical protein
MYKFYHAYNDQYAKYKEPLVQELERRDRERSEMDRIYRLIAFRQQARHLFTDKQHSRQLLEQKVRSQPPADLRAAHTERRMGSHPQQYISDRTQPNTPLPTPYPARKSERLLNIEEGYRQGVRRHDAKTEEINRLIDWQTEEAHRKIRGNFSSRRETNLERSGKVHPRGE